MLQLDLFEGAILNTKQQTQLETFISNQVVKVQSAEIKNTEMEIALIDGGFVKGVDFKNTFTVTNETRDISLGYSYDNSDFQVIDVKYKGNLGGIIILSKRFNRDLNEIVDIERTYVDFENNKFSDNGLVGSFRFVKASTLLTKLQEQRKRAEYNFNYHNLKTNSFATVVSEIQAKCPAAKVSKFTDYSYGSNYSTVDRVKAQFDNGSYITFNVRIDTVPPSFSIAKTYDARLVAMDSNQAIEFFTNQNK